MKSFLNLLKWLGMSMLLYPLFLVLAFFENNGNVGDWFWLEILIIAMVVGILLFLFCDFELVKRIKNAVKKAKNKNDQ
jgi:Na+/melibiose symporter-like transporter